MRNSVQLRAIRRASEVLGGEDKLAERLGMPLSAIHLWCEGTALIPTDIFLRLVDIIVEQTIDDLTPGDQPRQQDGSRKPGP